MAQTITSQIVTINETVVVAPTPSQLQQSGAFISVGGTTLATGTYQFLSGSSVLATLLSTTGNYAELTNMNTTFFANGNVQGVYVLELGVQTTTDDAVSALQTWIQNNPGVFYAYLVPADWDSTKDEVGSVTITSAGSGYTSAPTVTFSAPTSGTTATGTASIQNGEVISVTITNPGNGYTSAPTVTFSAPTSGKTATGTANLASAFNILAGNFASPTALTYFFGTTLSTTISNYSPNKSLNLMAESPLAPSTEFSQASQFYNWLLNNPGPANKLAPMGYRYLYGVTPWTVLGNSTAIDTILSAKGNLIETGSQGGISNSILFMGTMMDGTQAQWWYGIDWFNIQVNQALAAAVINGANSNPPLEYDQNGINTLLSVANQVAKDAVTNGCALSATVTAIPFSKYTTYNPGDYKAGIYKGFTATVVGQNGFLKLIFNLEALQLVV